MNREQIRKNFKVAGKKQLEDPNRNVTRGEFVEVIQQLGDNMGEIQKGLVDNVNTLYGHHVFPAQIELVALEKILIEKGIITQEEIDDKVKERKQDILDRAKAIKEDENGNLEQMKDDEAKEAENKAVVKAMSKSTTKKRKDKESK